MKTKAVLLQQPEQAFSAGQVPGAYRANGGLITDDSDNAIGH